MSSRGGSGPEGVDLGAVDLLARLRLSARRRGVELRLRRAPHELVELIELCGLGEALGQPEEREERLRVEEERQFRDPPV
jgi:anti-anti-sigma regulatory factor